MDAPGRFSLLRHDLGMGWPESRLVLWFSFFSLGSIGLSLAMLFSCYSDATSSLYIMSMQPTAIVTSRLALLRESDVNLDSIFGTNNISEESFFEFPLPYKYLFGISGVCRQYLISNTSSVVHTTCTRHFFPQVDLLRYVAEDILNSTTSTTTTNSTASKLIARTPSTKSGGNFTTGPNPPINRSTQLGYWVSLLNANYPNAKIDFGSRATSRARQSHVAAALLATSIPIALLTLIATIFFRPSKHSDFAFSFYPKWSVTLDVLDIIIVFVAAIEWTLLWVQAQNAYGSKSVLLNSNTPSGVRLGLGFLLLWLAVLAKLCVTPLMIVISICLIILVPLLLFRCCIRCLGSCSGGGGYESNYDQQRYDDAERLSRLNQDRMDADDKRRADADAAAQLQQQQYQQSQNNDNW